MTSPSWQERDLCLVKTTSVKWLGQQVVNAFPWDTAPKFLVRDRDCAYGIKFSRRTKGLGIREVKTAVEAPLMNAHCERLIGTLCHRFTRSST